MNIEWLREIRRLVRNGQRDAARSEFDQAAGAAPDNTYVMLARFVLLYYADEYEDSLSAAGAALEAARAAGDKLAEANALRSQAGALRMLDRHEDSLSAAGAAVEAARAAGDKLTEANAVRSQAEALRMLDRHEDSLKAAGAALEAARAAGDKLAEGNAIRSQAWALGMLARHDDALNAAGTALEAARAAGDKLAEANALQIQAEALRMLDRHEESLSAVDAAVEAARAARDKLAEANALVSQANTLRMLHRHEHSLKAAGAALDAARAVRDKNGQINALISQVFALCELGKTEERQTALESLSTLDPERARRLATYPVRPGWYVKIRRVFRQTREREREFRKVLYASPFKPRLPKDSPGGFYVLRNWASYTTVDLMRPSTQPPAPGRRQTGGGYLLWWQGWGLVIDPGLGFGEAFRAAGFKPRNISAVVATHHHIDHTRDMLPILTCLFEMNEEPLPRRRKQHQVDLLLGPGAFSAFADVAAYVPGVRSLRLLRAEESADLPLPRNVKATVNAVKTEHRDLTGRTDAGIGLRVDLTARDGKKCSVGLSGDTRFIKATAKAFADVDLMVVHIGSLYEYDIGESVDPPWHLGFSGVVQLLAEIKTHSKKAWDPLVLISEWGEELGPDRCDICMEVAKSAGVARVFPAEWRQCVALRAGGAQPACARNDGKVADHWHVTDTHYIDYLCGEHDHP